MDPVTAQELCAQALELPVPRCPHGRPIWHELSEESLLRLVDRPSRKSPFLLELVQELLRLVLHVGLRVLAPPAS